MGYDYRVLAMRLALRAASPNSRQKIAEEYAALIAKDPLLLPPHGGKMPRQDHASKIPLLSRPAAFTPIRFRPSPHEYVAVDVSLTDIPRRSTPTYPPAYAHSAGGRLE
jgi:hypothetical protein